MSPLLVDDGTGAPAGPVGLEEVNRYWDPQSFIYAAKLRPGEYYVSNRRELLVSVVGSLVGVVFHHNKSGSGALLHFSLPPVGGIDHSSPLADEVVSYGCHAMELAIAGTCRHGGSVNGVAVHLIGAAALSPACQATAAATVRFVRQYCTNYGLRLSSEDLGGSMARKIYFSPASGAMFIKPIDAANRTIEERDAAYLAALREQWLGEPLGVRSEKQKQIANG